MPSMTVRIPDVLKDEIVEKAQSMGISFTAFVSVAVRHYLDSWNATLLVPVAPDPGKVFQADHTVVDLVETPPGKPEVVAAVEAPISPSCDGGESPMEPTMLSEEEQEKALVALRSIPPAPKALEFPRVRPSRVPVVGNGLKIGRNAPCPCGSGKKYKLCCGR